LLKIDPHGVKLDKFWLWLNDQFVKRANYICNNENINGLPG